MKTTKEMIEVMQAYERGEKIECFNDEQWKDVNNPIWDWLHNDYRVKQKKKYVPFEDEQTFLRLNPISGKYAFTLLEMWWVVNEYDHWIKLHGSRENVEKDIKEWYEYNQNGGKINLLHWLMGAMY